MKKIVIIGSVIGIVIVIGLTVGYFAYANTSNNPWNGMSCEEMMNLALSSEHRSFTEQQHMQFHKQLEPCIQSMNNMHP
ncbi:MAG TPA: hypothetical protein VLC72_03990 [Nitrosopumilaceae archaeon]|nr:hypothetical protein [Nitrosopumilaceae archaeon]